MLLEIMWRRSTATRSEQLVTDFFGTPFSFFELCKAELVPLKTLRQGVLR